MLRAPRFAGFLYPESPSVLRDSIFGLLQKAPFLNFGGPIRAIIVPHSTFRFSCTTAAMAYGVLASQQQKIRNILLLGPSHRQSFPGIALPAENTFTSPLGRSPVSQLLRQTALEIPGISIRTGVHDNEHSLEIQLPYLQLVCPEAEILPMIIGESPVAVASEIMEVFSRSQDLLFVISSDFSHYYPYLNAKSLDEDTATRILNLDSSLTDNEACGYRWINGLTHLAKIKGWTARVIDLRNSGDEGGDTERVVGFGAIVFADSKLASFRGDSCSNFSS